MRSPEEVKNNIEIYNAEKAASWTLRFVQLADDLHLPNAGSEVENLLLSFMKWV